MTVAMAAPFTPISSPKMNIGSRMMFSPALMNMENMAIRGFPSALMTLFSAKPTVAIGVPRRMMVK